MSAGPFKLSQEDSKSSSSISRLVQHTEHDLHVSTWGFPAESVACRSSHREPASLHCVGGGIFHQQLLNRYQLHCNTPEARVVINRIRFLSFFWVTSPTVIASDKQRLAKVWVCFVCISRYTNSRDMVLSCSHLANLDIVYKPSGIFTAWTLSSSLDFNPDWNIAPMLYRLIKLHYCIL